MKPENVTVDVATKVMEIWQEHLGFWYDDNKYLDEPSLLSSILQTPDEWMAGMFQDRIGSKYTDDSKLYARVERGDLKITCYVQPHTVFKDNRQKAQDAEDSFNKAVKTYLNSIK